METNQKYPVSVTVEYPHKSSRLLALSGLLFLIPKTLILIPHFVLLSFLSIIELIAIVMNFIIVLFTGRQNKDIFNFLVGYNRWQTRVNSYLAGLTDDYPPFRLEE